MKNIEARIAYYVKKSAQYGSVHLSKRRNQYRLIRLLAYKKAVHNQILKNRETWHLKYNDSFGGRKI